MRLAMALVFTGALGCGQDFVRPPVARVDTCTGCPGVCGTVAACSGSSCSRPATVDLDDGQNTAVTIDGSLSLDAFHDPTTPLAFAWSFDDPGTVVDVGALDTPCLVARFSAPRPISVTLTVASPATGKSSTAQTHIGVRFPAP